MKKLAGIAAGLLLATGSAFAAGPTASLSQGQAVLTNSLQDGAAALAGGLSGGAAALQDSGAIGVASLTNGISGGSAIFATSVAETTNLVGNSVEQGGYALNVGLTEGGAALGHSINQGGQVFASSISNGSAVLLSSLDPSTLTGMLNGGLPSGGSVPGLGQLSSSLNPSQLSALSSLLSQGANQLTSALQGGASGSAGLGQLTALLSGLPVPSSQL